MLVFFPDIEGIIHYGCIPVRYSANKVLYLQYLKETKYFTRGEDFALGL